MQKPDSSEFASYYNNYISLVSGDVLDVLRSQAPELRALISALPEDKGAYAYAEGKWTIKQLLSHIIDGERVFSYRALRISRGDETPVEGFEQDDYIERSNANNRSFSDLLDEFERLRQANILLINNISDEDSRLMGTASGNPVSVRAIVYIMAGHVRHHLNILNQRYLVQ